MKMSSLWRKMTVVVLTLALIVPINLLKLITVNANTSNVPSQTVYLSDLNWESATHAISRLRILFKRTKNLSQVTKVETERLV